MLSTTFAMMLLASVARTSAMQVQVANPWHDDATRQDDEWNPWLDEAKSQDGPEDDEWLEDVADQDDDARQLLIGAGSPRGDDSGSKPTVPKIPGCYVWMPSGCPKKHFQAKYHWQRDTVSSTSQEMCETNRKDNFNSWCGATDAVTVFVPDFVPDLFAVPQTARSAGRASDSEIKNPGCYMMMPSGCPKRSAFPAMVWMRDAWGEENKGAGANEAACFSRKASFDTWCDITDTQMTFMPAYEGVVSQSAEALTSVQEESEYATAATQSGLLPTAPAVPVEPGCYVWMPTGCPQHTTFLANLDWKQDKRGKRAANNSATCYARKDNFDSWCGTIDATMAFVPPGTMNATMVSVPP